MQIEISSAPTQGNRGHETFAGPEKKKRTSHRSRLRKAHCSKPLVHWWKPTGTPTLPTSPLCPPTEQLEPRILAAARKGPGAKASPRRFRTWEGEHRSAFSLLYLAASTRPDLQPTKTKHWTSHSLNSSVEIQEIPTFQRPCFRRALL